VCCEVRAPPTASFSMGTRRPDVILTEAQSDRELVA